MNGWAGFVFWLLVYAASPALLAQAVTIPVHVEESSCETVPREALEAALRVELGERVVDRAVPGSLRVRVSCPDDRALLAITRPDGSASESATALRRVSDDVRPRVIALTIAEIVRNLERTPPPPPEPIVLPPEAQPLPAPRPRPAWQLGLSGHARSYGTFDDWLAGGGLGVRYTWHKLELGIQAVALTSERETKQGSARTLAVLARPTLAFRHVAGPWSARGGAGCELGQASVAGDAKGANGHDARVEGFSLSPYLFVGGGHRLAQGLELNASLELGWVVVPVFGQIEQGRDVNLDGPWGALSIDVTYTF